MRITPRVCTSVLSFNWRAEASHPCLLNYPNFRYIYWPHLLGHISVATSARPDMVIIQEKKVLLVELTVPYNSPESLRNTRKRKETKENYQLLLSELDSLGFTASLTTLEVGALGHSLPQAHSDIKHLVPYLEKKRARQLFDDAGRISITCSHALFRARSELTWNDNRPLQILATTNNP